MKDENLFVLNRITALLKERGVQQKVLCEHLGLKAQAYTNWKGGGNDSYMKYLPQIAAFFGVVAAVYPNLAFITRQVSIDGERNTINEDIRTFMRERRYDLESEDAEGMTFRIHGIAGKLSKMYEDRITIRWNAEGFTMEGLRKDILRLATGLETTLQN